jgi:heme-degrading monooxygenase HmoA
MAHVLAHLKVNDFASWKEEFGHNAEMRSGVGSKGGFVFQSPDDPNEVIVLLEWNDLDGARSFAGSAQLKEAMERAGVVGDAHIHLLELADQPSA